jgi:hypothetical protein
MIERPDVLLARCFSESCQRGRKKWTNTATNAELPNKKKHHPDPMLSNVSGQNETRRVLGASVPVARRRPRVLGPLRSLRSCKGSSFTNLIPVAELSRLHLAPTPNAGKHPLSHPLAVRAAIRPFSLSIFLPRCRVAVARRLATTTKELSKEAINYNPIQRNDREPGASCDLEGRPSSRRNTNERAAPVITSCKVPTRPSLFLQKWSPIATLPNS